MKRLAVGLFATCVVIGPGSAALAAPVRVFKATGIFRTEAGHNSQSVHLTIGYRSGHVRIETDSKAAGQSIILATKGQDDVAMLDPGQKIVIHMKPSVIAAANGATSGGLTSYQSMLDPTGMKAFILQHGHKVGPGPGILGHRTTVYEAARKGNQMKVWFADDLSLPLRIQGRSSTGSRFDVDITSLNLHPTFGAHYFDASPPGYTSIKAQTSGLRQ